MNGSYGRKNSAGFSMDGPWPHSGIIGEPGARNSLSIRMALRQGNESHRCLPTPPA